MTRPYMETLNHETHYIKHDIQLPECVCVCKMVFFSLFINHTHAYIHKNTVDYKVSLTFCGAVGMYRETLYIPQFIGEHSG